MNGKDFIEGFKKGQKGFGDSIAAIVNSALFSFVYLIGVGFTSVFAKLIGKKFLELNLDSKRYSYWSDLNLDKKTMEEYYRQF